MKQFNIDHMLQKDAVVVKVILKFRQTLSCKEGTHPEIY